MRYDSNPYEQLFAQDCTKDEQPRQSGVGNYRVKTIKAGNQLEVEAYPIWNTVGERYRAEQLVTKEAQRNLNARNARKHLSRKLNANFTDADLSVTLTYGEGEVPDIDGARTDMRNYIKRIKRARAKRGLPPPKYIYVIEYGEGDGRRKRVHHHLIISGGMERDEVEALWRKGRVNADRLKADAYGYEALARYLLKEKRARSAEGQGKCYSCSRNLKDPTITISDTKLSKRQAQRLAEDVESSAPEIFGRLYPAYEYNDCRVARSDFVAGVYVYARLHREPKEKPKKVRRKRE